MSLSKSLKRPLDDHNVFRPSKKTNQISVSLYAAVKARDWLLEKIMSTVILHDYIFIHVKIKRHLASQSTGGPSSGCE